MNTDKQVLEAGIFARPVANNKALNKKNPAGENSPAGLGYDSLFGNIFAAFTFIHIFVALRTYNSIFVAAFAFIAVFAAIAFTFAVFVFRASAICFAAARTGFVAASAFIASFTAACAFCGVFTAFAFAFAVFVFRTFAVCFAAAGTNSSFTGRERTP